MNQLWHGDLTQLGSDIEARLVPMLSPLESEKLRRLKRSGRRKEYILSRALMRMALSRQYKKPLRHWQFSESPNAAPILLNPTDTPLFISLSHSGDCVMLALSDQAVGLDVERIEARKQTDSIARKVFTAEQQAYLKRLPEHQSKHYFYQLWTHKEALVKAMAGSIPSFQMISSMAWPKHDFQIQHGVFGQYALTLASKQPTRIFCQFDAIPFQQANPADFLSN